MVFRSLISFLTRGDLHQLFIILFLIFCAEDRKKATCHYEILPHIQGKLIFFLTGKEQTYKDLQRVIILKNNF